MFILLIGGIETSSSKIISAIGGNGGSLWQSSALWIAVAAALVGFFATNRISAGGFSFQASGESVRASFMIALWVFFASDLFSIVSKVRSVACPIGATISQCSWEFWVIWAIIIPLLGGYAVSIIQFVGGSD